MNEEYLTDAEGILEAIKRYWNAVERRSFTKSTREIDYKKFRDFEKRNLIAIRMTPQKGDFVVRFKSHGLPAFLLDTGEVVFKSLELANKCAELYGKYALSHVQVMQIA